MLGSPKAKIGARGRRSDPLEVGDAGAVRNAGRASKAIYSKTISKALALLPAVPVDLTATVVVPATSRNSQVA